jgi:formylmethanofuran dehydrogenase subunit A
MGVLIGMDAGAFKALILPPSTAASTASSEEDITIETLSPSTFDPQNQHTKVFQAVRDAVAGPGTAKTTEQVGLRVYRVQYGLTRAEYWVLALDGQAQRIVGMMVRAVES